MADPLRASREFFAARAADYRASPSHAEASDLERMLAALDGAGTGRALDVATGAGFTAIALSRRHREVVALDATSAMASAAQANARAAAAEIRFALGDALRMPFASERFDVVASRIAPHHFADLGSFASESRRVLRPSGRLYVFDLTAPEDPGGAAHVSAIERLRDPSHVESWTPSAWRRALDAAGLRVETLRTGSSEFDLESWIARARMPPEREASLRRLLERGHPAAPGYGLAPGGRMRVLRVEIVASRP